MVLAEDRALHLEHVRGEAQVAHELAGDVRDRLEGRGEHLLPRLEDRVVGVPRVERDLAVVGVDRGLDRVADVVDLIRRHERLRLLRVRDEAAHVLALRVRVLVARRVPVDDPHHAAVDDAGVRVLVDGEVRGDLADALRRVAVVDDLRLVVDLVGQEDLLRLELQRVDEALEDVVDLRPAVALERRVRLVRAVDAGRVVQLHLVARLGAADDGVVGRVLAEVHARLEVPQVTRGGDARLEEHGLAVGGALRSVRRHERVAVRVDEVLVDPRRAGVRGAQLADRDHRVLHSTVDLVPVDVEVVAELVVLPELLQLAERVAHDSGVEDADVRGRRGVLAERARRGVRGRVVGDLLDVREAVGLPRRLDVALVVLRLERALVGLHLEALHDGRVGRADEDAGDDQAGGADDRQAPAADDGRDDEEQRHDAGDAGEDRATGDDRVDVRVRGTREQPAVRVVDHRRVLVEPDAHALQQEVDARGDRDLDARALGDAHLAAREPHGAVEVARGEDAEHGDDDDGRGEADDRVVEGQLEHVEGRVELELRIHRAGGRAVEPQQRALPAARGRDAREEAEDRGDREHGEAAQRLDDLLVAVELRVELRVDGP